MSAGDYFYDYDDYDIDSVVECKYCGAFPLDWEQRKRKWVLIDEDGEVHNCRTTPADAKDFPII